MKNKGYTLVELLAVAAIISLLILLSIGVYFNVEKNVLESQYNNLVNDILNKAEEFAQEYGSTEAIDINLQFLIDNGYYFPDDEEYVYDPRNNDILNCHLIHIILKDGEYVASWGENSVNEDGTCNDSNLTVSAVEIYCNGAPCSDGWYGTDVVLTLSGLDDDELKSSVVEWTSLTGFYEKQDSDTNKKIVVSPQITLDTVYSALIKTSDKAYNISKNIKIDKEEPILVANDLDVNYSGEQKFVVSVSDKNGSGIDGVALTKGSCEDATYTDDFDIPITDTGTFNVCVKDNAGNIVQESVVIKGVTFDYNDLSNPNGVTDIPVYYLEDNSNYSLLLPTRDGYSFAGWVDEDGNTVYEFSNLDDGDVAYATWDFNDVDVDVDRTDTEHVFIENPVNIIMVLDASGSMNHGDRAAQLRTAVSNLVNSVNFDNGSTVSIVQFHHGIKSQIVTSTNKSELLSYVAAYSPVWGDGTNFVQGLTGAYNILTSDNFDKDSTFIIFFTDGFDEATTSSERILAKSKVLPYVNTIYGIGLDIYTSYKYMIYEVITSSDYYYDATSSEANLSEIFAAIEEEIKEEINQNTDSGLLYLPNLVIENEHPFILTVNGTDYSFYSINDMINKKLIVKVNNEYYLDFVGVDNYYKLNGNLSSVSVSYYYH